MRARLVLCLTIVTAFQGRSVTLAAISEDVWVPGGTAAAAAALGIDPVPDRSRFIGELTRLAFDIPDGKNAATDVRLRHLKTLLASMRRTAGQAVPTDGLQDLVPAPLTAAIWGHAVFHRPLTPADLFAAIFGDRQAGLLCHGLAGLDDNTLQFFADHPALIAQLHERAAPAFAAFGSHLHIRDGGVVPPGGAGAIPIWEAALGERVSEPERFVRALFELRDGRIAYLYDTIAQIDRRQAAFALGLWIDDPHLRVRRFKALVDVNVGSYRGWRVHDLPFVRPLHDIATFLSRVQTDEAGRPVGGSWELWSGAFDVSSPDVAAGQLAAADAAWLADVIIGGDSRIRADRMDQFAFGQRVFAGAAADTLPDVIEAVRALPRCRLLMLTLERLGIRNPAVYAAASRRALVLTALDPSRSFPALAQFQGTLALLERMARVRGLDGATAAGLAATLISVPLTGDGRYDGAIAGWIQQELRPALAPADDVESALVAALAGKRADDRASVAVLWEGQQYRLDFQTSELRRLERVREKQGGARVDWAIDVYEAARKLAGPAVTVADIRTTKGTLERIAGELSSNREPGAPADVVETSKRARNLLRRVVTQLSRVGKEKDARAAARIVEPCGAVADGILTDALLSLAYAVDLGDPEGTVLLAGNVALRHDFGLAVKDAEARARMAWGMPKAAVAPGTAWHVAGSLLGLDIGLAPLALRRINADHVIGAPTLTANERETFAASLALMNPFALEDADRDAIGVALARGRARVAALTADTVNAVGDEIGMDGWRRRAARWTLANERMQPTDVLGLFSMTELLRLGGGASVGAYDSWGMAAVDSVGCICTRLMPSGQWTLWTGRPQLGLLAGTVADLNLVVAEMLYQLKLPAALARQVLAGAVQDFIDEAKPTDPDDWLTLARSAQSVTRERIEDYISAAAADGPLLPVDTAGAFR